MKTTKLLSGVIVGGTVLALLVFAGCATHRIDWQARVGNYSYDQAVMEFGPPDKHAKLEDGTIVAEWLTSRGFTTQTYSSSGYGYYPSRYSGPMVPGYVETTYYPGYFLRLTFTPDAKLRAWKKFAK
jgi:hypothetical protein